jgi:hypothetical protein
MAEIERIRREIADHAVVDAAEDVLGHAWITHLEELRHAAADTVTEAAQNVGGAQCLVRICQAVGEPRRLVVAQGLLERSERALADSVDESSTMLSVVEAQLESLARATAERIQRRRDDANLLHATHTAMFGASGTAPGADNSAD